MGSGMDVGRVVQEGKETGKEGRTERNIKVRGQNAELTTQQNGKRRGRGEFKKRERNFETGKSTGMSEGEGDGKMEGKIMYVA